MEHKYAGFWIRFWATLLDTLIISAIDAIIAVIFGVNLRDPGFAFNVLETVISTCYFVIMTTLLGQTLGKMVCNIKVISQDDQPNSWGRILLRETIGKFISFLIFFIGFIMAGIDSKKRALHDRMGKTYVVKMESSKIEN